MINEINDYLLKWLPFVFHLNVFLYIQQEFVYQILWKTKFKLIFCVIRKFLSRHHHHGMMIAQIQLILSHYLSLSSLAFGRSATRHPTSEHSWQVHVFCCLVHTGVPRCRSPLENELHIDFAGHLSLSLCLSLSIYLSIYLFLCLFLTQQFHYFSL